MFAHNTHARKSTSVIDPRTTHHASCTFSTVTRKLTEEAVTSGTTIGGLRRLKQRGHAKRGLLFRLTAAAYDLVYIRTLIRVGVARQARHDAAPSRIVAADRARPGVRDTRYCTFRAHSCAFEYHLH